MLNVLALQARDEALADFSQAIALEPSNPVFRHNRGFCHRNVQQPVTVTLGGLNLVSVQMGAFDKAVEDYTAAIEV
jgi:hypothetical protein